MKLALLDVSHWHLPLYVPALLRSGVDVVAVCDADSQARERVARRFGARAYADVHSLLAAEALDFAFVFSRHCHMMRTGLALVERGIAFSVEKPGGLCASQVRRVREAARARDLFVAVPFVQRVSPLYAAIRRLSDEQGVTFTHSSWRFFAGPPQRYREAGNGWLLDPAQSGGGCLVNLAPHFVDLILRLHGPRAGPLGCRLSNRLHGEPVEDYAMLSMACRGGATAAVETGYCFPAHPAKREFSFSLVSATHYLRACAEGVRVYDSAGEAEVMTMDLDADPLYGQFVHRVLDDFHWHRPPLAGLDALEAVMEVLDAARADALPPPP